VLKCAGMARTSIHLAALGVAMAACGAETEVVVQTDSALKTEDHRTIAVEHCVRAGFHDAFCARVGAEAFVVDAQEWERPWMHAMPIDGQSHCDAAAEVQEHLARRGREIRAALAGATLGRRETEAIAEALGRTLHTLQDNCAHEGMSNQQHAWHSVRSFCEHTGEDPDLSPAALACAANETKLVFRAMKEAFRANGKDPASLWEAHDMSAPQPGLAHVCEFVGEWSAFDGRDSRWDIAITGPVFRDTFTRAMLEDANVAPACEGRASLALAIPHPRPRVSALDDPTCTPIRLLCDR
jgi:hypothetical protein